MQIATFVASYINFIIINFVKFIVRSYYLLSLLPLISAGKFGACRSEKPSTAATRALLFMATSSVSAPTTCNLRIVCDCLAECSVPLTAIQQEFSTIELTFLMLICKIKNVLIATIIVWCMFLICI